MQNHATGAEKVGADRYGVSGIIIIEDKVLLVLRHKNDYFGARYEVPGGGVGNHETLEDALIREVNEETGLEIKSMAYLGYIETKIHGTTLKKFDFLVEVVDSSKIVLSHEHERYTWASKSDLAKLPLTAFTKKALERFWK